MKTFDLVITSHSCRMPLNLPPQTWKSVDNTEVAVKIYNAGKVLILEIEELSKLLRQKKKMEKVKH